MSARVSPVQLELRPRTHGGRREGSGRKRLGNSLPHRRRPKHDGRHPVHVTLRLRPGLPNLRVKKLFERVREAIADGADRFGFRLVHYSVQSNHLHLIAEAEDREALSRGLKGLQVRLARRINAACGRKGSVFADRYHSRALTSPRAVRNAVAYCINNARKHARQRGREMAPRWVDPYSTARRFFEEARGHISARTWLLRVGWQRWGPIEPDYVPSSG